jgi:hypothetical protein
MGGENRLGVSSSKGRTVFRRLCNLRFRNMLIRVPISTAILYTRLYRKGMTPYKNW